MSAGRVVAERFDQQRPGREYQIGGDGKEIFEVPLAGADRLAGVFPSGISEVGDLACCN